MDKIIASPQFGRIFSKSSKLFMIISMIASILAFAYSVTLLILIIVGLWDYTRGIIAALIMLGILGVLLFSVMLWMLLREAKFKRNIIKWEKDFIKTFATVSLSKEGKGVIKNYIVTSKFKYNENQYENIKRAGNSVLGYDRILNKCIGNKVPIYYSPTYDEIVFIKES